ncbi:MAG: hypothetical protein AAF830_05400 [Pseudomonadota bacterium]
MKLLLSSAAAIAALSASAFAGTIITDFEGLGPNGTVIDTADLEGIASITVASNGSVQDTLITFNTDLPSTIDPDLVGPFDDPTTMDNDMKDDLDNIAIIPENMTFSSPDDEAAGGTITITFDKGVTVESFDVVDSKSGNVKLFSGNTQVAMIAIPNVDTDDDTLPNLFTTVDLGLFTNVTSMQITFGESGGFDNLTFTPVPVPAALPLFAAGLGLVAARRKARR